MSQAAIPIPPPETQSKLSVALGSILGALVVTALKLVTGLLTNSLGLLSDAAHSGIDLLASIITLFSVRVADKPADEEHPYGHAKIESVAAFIETGFMLLSSLWIIKEVIQRLFLHPEAPTLSVWPFAVVLLAIAVDYTRARALLRVARRTHSPALEAEALHFSTDIWSSIAVLIGLTATFIGTRFHLNWLVRADALAALVVSVIILNVGYRLARRTVDTLVDSVPGELRHQLIAAVETIDGVIDVDRLRLRHTGERFYVDLTIGLARNLTFQRSEQITEDATAAVLKILPSADVVVHSVPRASLKESIFDRVRAVAARHNISIHDVGVQDFHGKLHLEQHVEVDETLSLRAAHDFVTTLEAAMRKEVPEISTILTHIESEPATIERSASREEDRALEVRLRRIAQELPEILDIHEVVVGRMGDRTQISCHCTLPDDLSMTRVHEVITALESNFKAECPEVLRVLIHPEPATDNRR